MTEALRVLHFSPETALRRRLSRLNHLTYTTAALIPTHVDQQIDIMEIPYGAGTVDVVICNHVLEHVPDDHKAMLELARVLSPDGWAVLSVPQDLDRAETYEDWSISLPEARKAAFGQPDHLRVYGRDFQDRLAGAGLSVKTVNPTASLSDAEILRYGLLSYDRVHIARHP